MTALSYRDGNLLDDIGEFGFHLAAVGALKNASWQNAVRQAGYGQNFDVIRGDVVA